MLKASSKLVSASQITGVLPVVNGGTGVTTSTGTTNAVLSNSPTITTPTIAGATLSGTVAGGGNQLNNVIIGTTTPLAGAFTTLSATGALTAPSSYSWTAANTPIVVGLSALNYNSSGIYSKYSFNAYHNGTNDIYMSGGGYGATQILSYTPGTGNLIIQTAVGGTGIITWVATAVFSPTGLAVTGTLTSTGTISPVQATTAGAPAYVKGAIYFDTTLNKLRVGGATAWETITST